MRKSLIYLKRDLSLNIEEVEPKLKNIHFYQVSQQEAESFKEYEDTWNKKKSFLRSLKEAIDCCDGHRWTIPLDQKKREF